MKRISKLVTLLLIGVILFSTTSFSSLAASKDALPVSAGIQALRNGFESGIGPKESGFALDYAYYSPVGTEDNNKYPLVIFLHGIGHGDYVDSQLDDSDMPYWSSYELQSRFDAGGAFILLPRAPEDKLVYWNSSLLESLRALIDDFIASHSNNVDTTKIFISGSSAGGEMAWDMAIAYPDYFAGIFPIASTGTVSPEEVEKCKDIAIWMISSEHDPVVNYSLITVPLWNNVLEYNNNPEKCRLSTFSDVIEPSGNSASDNHHMAKVITYDFHMLDSSPYPNVVTVNGNSNELLLESPDGIIYWMNSVSSDYDGDASEGTGTMHISVFDHLINMIRNIGLKVVNIFQRILGL